MNSLIKRFKPYMGNKGYLLTLAQILSALSAVINVLPYIFIWLIVRQILINGAGLKIEDVYLKVILVLVFSLLGLISYFLTLLLSHLAAFRVESEMQNISIKRIFGMPLGFFSKAQSGKTRKIINDGAASSHGFLAHQLPDMAGVLITPIAYILMMFFVNWKLGLVSLIPLFIGFAVMASMQSKSQKEFMDVYYGFINKMSAESVEYVRGVPVVKAFGQTIKSFTSFYKVILGYKDAVLKYTASATRKMAMFYTLLSGIALFLVPFGVLFYTSQNLGEFISDFVFYLIVTPMFSRLMIKTMYFSHNKMIAGQALDGIDNLLDYEELTYKTGNVNLKDYSIEFKNVSFSYNKDEKYAVKNLSFKLEEGKTLALVGASGSGKTTIARLAARFWDVDEGEILIGGVNIKDIPKEQLMSDTAFVFQNTRLFSRSLRENILIGRPDASEDEILRALEISCSKEIVDDLPDGLDTVIGTDGTYLSGGQMQRIALARAVIKNASISLLDEATAFADPENEKLIQQALFNIGSKKTTIMIAHRLTSVAEADTIMLMDRGEVVESGSFEELMASDSKFKAMFEEFSDITNWNIAAKSEQEGKDE